jgi:peptidoglycan-associated lipoprotein
MTVPLFALFDGLGNFILYRFARSRYTRALSDTIWYVGALLLSQASNKTRASEREIKKEISPMKRSFYALLVLATVVLVLVISGTGCAKKVAPPPPVAKTEPPPPPPPPPPPSPTISLSASPSAIEAGQSTTLSWNTSNATSVTIDNGVGTVEPSGRRTVSPSASTTYTARATGPGGNAVAEARVTVTSPPPPTPPPPPAISDSEFFSNNIKDAFFDFDKYDIREDARAALQGDARALSQRPGIRFTIEGHCDERGSEKYNMALGDRRANAAKEFLVSQGVDGSRMDTISYGKEKPFCEEHNEECWQSNRRAHLVMR